jgi:predicted ATPase
VEVLADRDVLLWPDNCEHFIEAVADLVGRLTAGSVVAMVATSQETLNVPDEHIVFVAPLPTETAAELFTVRARSADRDFTVDDADRPLIADICRRVDGLPLGIELIAARMRSLTPKQVLDQLDDVALLNAQGRDTTERHRTLDATVRWSYSLLDPVRRTVLTVLAESGTDLDGCRRPRR